MMSACDELGPHLFRAVWISDVHLGFRGCRADFLLDFLHTVESEYLYLVGDIIPVDAPTLFYHHPKESKVA